MAIVLGIRMLLHKVYKMNTDHKNRRAQQNVPQNKHQLWEEPCSFVNTPNIICSDYLCFGLFTHLVPIITLHNLYSVVPTPHTNNTNKQTSAGSMSCKQTGYNIRKFHNMQFYTMDGIKWLTPVFKTYKT